MTDLPKVPPGRPPLPVRLALGGVLAASALATLLGATRTSLTFDEVTMMSGGVRAIVSGRHDLIEDHPPLGQLLYGAAALAAGARPPADPGEASRPGFRHDYGRQLLFGSGSEPGRIAFAARLISCACSCALVSLVFLFTRQRAGPAAGLLAAGLAAFLPDMLAHGGVAYNDMPVALLLFAGAWAADAATRRPSVRHGALFGGLLALAAGVKFSGAALLPLFLVLLALEAPRRARDPIWRTDALRALLAAGAAAYLLTVAAYRGDLPLAGLREGLVQQSAHLAAGHVAPAYLLGRTSWTGWWYFYPVAFLLKTPVAFQALLILGAAAALLARDRPDSRGGHWRAAWVTLMVLAAPLLGSRLAIGFRHALPLLPWLCVLAAAGLHRLPGNRRRFVRAPVGLLLAWHVLGTLSWHPHYLAYTSEYVRGRDRGHEALLDSNLDWGQGLLELRDHLRRNGIPRVALSYFGSALPEAYGISYLPLESFLPLPERPLPLGEPPPDRVVISATHLHGLYLDGDPFRAFREAAPEAVVAHTLFVYRATASPPAVGPTAAPAPPAR